MNQSGDNEISYNRIKYMSSRGIVVQGSRLEMPATLYGVTVIEGNRYDFNHTRNNDIKFNDVSDCILSSQDAGLFYASVCGKDNILDNNRFHDVSQPNLNPGYVFGIYLDDIAS